MRIKFTSFHNILCDGNASATELIAKGFQQIMNDVCTNIKTDLKT